MNEFGTDLLDRTDITIDTPWEVILWDDPVSLISLVIRVIKKVFNYDTAKAERLTMQVHNEGRSVVWSGDKETASAYCVALHSYALGATIQRSQ